jgi:hypothetical protein
MIHTVLRSMFDVDYLFPHNLSDTLHILRSYILNSYVFFVESEEGVLGRVGEYGSLYV